MPARDALHPARHLSGRFGARVVTGFAMGVACGHAVFGQHLGHFLVPMPHPPP